MTHIKGILRSRRPTKIRFLHLDMDDEFPWGEHQNRTVRWVLANNPCYVDWIITTGGDPSIHTRFVFTDHVKRVLGAAKQSPHYEPDLYPWDFHKRYRKLKVSDAK